MGRKCASMRCENAATVTVGMLDYCASCAAGVAARRNPSHTNDLARERAARDEAMARVEEHADPDWNVAAREAVRQCALAHAEFISDDVWMTGLDKPPEARALGPAIRWALREGLIARTNRVRQSSQAGCHAMPRNVWRSLAYERSISA